MPVLVRLIMILEEQISVYALLHFIYFTVPNDVISLLIIQPQTLEAIERHYPLLSMSSHDYQLSRKQR